MAFFGLESSILVPEMSSWWISWRCVVGYAMQGGYCGFTKVFSFKSFWKESNWRRLWSWASKVWSEMVWCKEIEEKVSLFLSFSVFRFNLNFSYRINYHLSCRLNEFKIECPPAFLSAQREDTQHLDQCPEPFRACLVSSYSQARRSIAVNLADYGVTPEFLFKYKPKIVVLEYYTNRNDCSCQYTLEAVIRRSG